MDSGWEPSRPTVWILHREDDYQLVQSAVKRRETNDVTCVYKRSCGDQKGVWGQDPAWKEERKLRRRAWRI